MSRALRLRTLMEQMPTDDADLELFARAIESSTATPGVEAGVAISAMPDREPGAMAFASMSRTRRADHETVWAQLFIDGVFIDAARAAEVESGESCDSDASITFIARLMLPEEYLDGTVHRVRVAFVGPVSGVTSSENDGRDRLSRVASHPPPQAVAEAELMGRTFGQRALRDHRAAAAG